jgi:hypothetical protein
MKHMNKITTLFCRRNIFIVWTTVIACFLFSCNKLVDTKASITNINAKNVYAEDRTAIAVLTGLYTQMVTAFTGGSASSLSLRTALSADEMTLYNGAAEGNLNAYYKNALVANSANSYGGDIWSQMYNFIFICNSAIEGLSSSSSLTPSVRKQLLGEAKFMRAFFHFYIVNLYGNAPLVLSTDPDINIALLRSEKVAVYKQIIEDLKEAQQLLSPIYVNGSLLAYAANAERIRPTVWVATALLARVYLYDKEYANAESEATAIINEKTLLDTLPVNDVFLKNSKEAIWQLQPVQAGRNTEDAFTFIIPANGPTDLNGTSGNPVYLSNYLLSIFELGDKRRLLGNWINSRTVGTNTYYYPYKYKATTGLVSEYCMVFRVGEQYLIRAEARAQQMKIMGINSAESDLNLIRKRAGLLPTLAKTKDEMVKAIMQERQVELFSEWGHRWLDIKRTGSVDAVMNVAAIAKGTVWEPYQQLYPLPFRDIQNSPVLVQNDGYIK